MTDFINKVISILLVFALIVASLLWVYRGTESLAQRQIFNDVSYFIDRVKDTATITQEDLDKLYMDCNSHGLTVEVSVKRLVTTSVFNNDLGIAQTNYFAVDSPEALKQMNAGDCVQVSVREMTTSSSRRLVYKLLHIDEGNFEFTSAGVVG